MKLKYFIAISIFISTNAFSYDKEFEANLSKANKSVLTKEGIAYDKNLQETFEKLPTFRSEFNECVKNNKQKQSVRGYFQFVSNTNYRVVLEPKTNFSSCLVSIMEGKVVPNPPYLPYLNPFEFNYKLEDNCHLNTTSCNSKRNIDDSGCSENLDSNLSVVYVEKQTETAFPNRIANVNFYKTINYEEQCSGCGVSIKYNNCDLNIDVIIYKGGVPFTLKEQIEQQFQNAVNDIYLMEKMNRYSNVKELEQLTEEQIGNFKFHHSIFSYLDKINGNRLVNSNLYLSSYKNHFLKIRITSYNGEQKNLVINFMTNLTKLLK